MLSLGPRTQRTEASCFPKPVHDEHKARGEAPDTAPRSPCPPRPPPTTVALGAREMLARGALDRAALQRGQRRGYRRMTRAREAHSLAGGKPGSARALRKTPNLRTLFATMRDKQHGVAVFVTCQTRSGRNRIPARFAERVGDSR